MSDAIHLVAGFANSASTFTTRIPSLSDTANIQQAFILYHYGIEPNAGPPALDNSPYGYFTTLTTRVTDLENTPSGGGIVTNNVPFDITKADNSLAVLPEGYIWVDENGSVESISLSGTAIYSPNEPENPTNGLVWIDSDQQVQTVIVGTDILTQLTNNLEYAVTIVSSSASITNKNLFFVDTSSASCILNLPSIVQTGDRVKISDLANNAQNNNIYINRSGNKINSENEDFVIDVNNGTIEMIYTNSTYGWRIL